MWDELIFLSSSNISDNWCALGDINVTKSLTETEGGDDIWDSGMDDFKNCVESLGLEDLSATSAFFTWWNSQDLHPIQRKLDRALINSDWLMNLGLAQAHFGNNGL